MIEHRAYEEKIFVWRPIIRRAMYSHLRVRTVALVVGGRAATQCTVAALACTSSSASSAFAMASRAAASVPAICVAHNQIMTIRNQNARKAAIRTRLQQVIGLSERLGCTETCHALPCLCAPPRTDNQTFASYT